jgi:hypothetical protein
MNLSLLLSSSSILDGVELGLECDVCILEVCKLCLELGKLGLHVGQWVLICHGCQSNAILLGLMSCNGQKLGGILVETIGFFVFYKSLAGSLWERGFLGVSTNLGRKIHLSDQISSYVGKIA